MLQMMTRYRDVRAANSTFQVRPETLNTVDVMDALNPFIIAMIDCPVVIAPFCQRAIVLNSSLLIVLPGATLALMIGLGFTRFTFGTTVAFNAPWR